MSSATEPVAVAYLNWSRWVADCPRPHCGNAEQFGRTPTGQQGGLTGKTFRCREEEGGCGLRCAASWPPNVADIERMVMPRPVPSTRNWVPGEDLHDLLIESAAHGLLPASREQLESGESGTTLRIVGDRIIGELPSMDRAELEGGS